MPKAKKMITIDERLLAYGKKEAARLGLNFSSYICLLIANDEKNQQRLEAFDRAHLMGEIDVALIEKTKA